MLAEERWEATGYNRSVEDLPFFVRIGRKEGRKGEG